MVSGCATDRAISYCSIHTLGNNLAEPLGLVRIDPSLEKDLRAQLPSKMRSGYLCWYTSRQDIVVSYRNDPNLSNYGYTFTQQNGLWKLSNEPPKILALPRVIE
jgi:hypothetical protein